MNINQKPNLIIVIAGTTLVSGIVNLFWGLVASYTAIGTIVGVVCLPFAVLPAILGTFEIIYAAKMLSNPPQPLRPSTSIAVFEILCFLTGNIFSMIVGILSLVFYNDVTVKNYFAELNATQTPPSSASASSASTLRHSFQSQGDASLSASPEPVPALPVEESAPEPVLPAPPAEPEVPAKPKRGRKVA
jgi:hypothetical protein